MPRLSDDLRETAEHFHAAAREYIDGGQLGAAEIAKELAVKCEMLAISAESAADVTRDDRFNPEQGPRLTPEN